MTHIFSLIQLISAPVLVAFILLQRPQQDDGGFGSETVGFAQTRRGFEKFLFNATIVVAVIFATASLLVVTLGS